MGPITAEVGAAGSRLAHRHAELEPPQIPALLDFTTDPLCDLRQVNEPLWASISLEWRAGEDSVSY